MTLLLKYVTTNANYCKTIPKKNNFYSEMYPGFQIMGFSGPLLENFGGPLQSFGGPANL